MDYLSTTLHELLKTIFQHAGGLSRIMLSMVCKRFYTITKLTPRSFDGVYNDDMCSILRSLAKSVDGDIYGGILREDMKNLIIRHASIEYIVVSDNIDYCERDAARYGRIDILEYLMAVTDRDMNVSESAACGGQLETLKFLRSKGVEFTIDTLNYCAENGHLDCLKYVHESGVDWTGQADLTACENAAEGHHLDCLKYAHENGCPWNETFRVAIMNGSPDIIQYARDNGCPIPDDVLDVIAQKGNLAQLQEYHTLGYPITSDTFDSAILGNNSSGCFECLQYLVSLYEPGTHPWNEQTSYYATRNIKYLRYIHENGCPLGDKLCDKAIEHNNVECLRYAHENGLPWTTDMTAFAAKHFDCLKYALENGAPYDERVCQFAARATDDRILPYAHEFGCPWNSNVYIEASKHGYISRLQYAYHYGCPVSVLDIQMRIASMIEGTAKNYLQWIVYSSK